VPGACLLRYFYFESVLYMFLAFDPYRIIVIHRFDMAQMHFEESACRSSLQTRHFPPKTRKEEPALYQLCRYILANTRRLIGQPRGYNMVLIIYRDQGTGWYYRG
jgi:hypothetical protein